MKNSPSAERNWLPIYQVLSESLPIKDSIELFEIGSGTGQHAAYITPKIEKLFWQCSERLDSINEIEPWRQFANCSRIKKAVSFDILNDNPIKPVDAVFTANTLHIFDQSTFEAFLLKAPKMINFRGLIYIYGPFKYNGEYTTESNKEFDSWISENYPGGFIKEKTEIDSSFEKAGLKLIQDIAMPANNQLLIYQLHDFS